MHTKTELNYGQILFENKTLGNFHKTIAGRRRTLLLFTGKLFKRGVYSGGEVIFFNVVSFWTKRKSDRIIAKVPKLSNSKNQTFSIRDELPGPGESLEGRSYFFNVWAKKGELITRGGGVIQERSSPQKYYRKRGSASYIVREVLSVREREREIQTDRERDGSDVTIVALKLAMNSHFPLPKFAIGDELTLSLAKNSHFSFLPSHFPSLPSRRGLPLWR